MKQTLTLLLALLLFPLLQPVAKAQADATSHFGVLGQWCGWDQITNFDFQLRHDGARNITFHTDSVRRMIIRGSNGIAGMGSDNTGWAGIGMVNNPMAMLHLGETAMH